MSMFGTVARLNIEPKNRQAPVNIELTCTTGWDAVVGVGGGGV